MSLTRVLKDARRMLAGGSSTAAAWARDLEPEWWVGSELGNERHFTDPDVDRFTVQGALMVAALRDGSRPAHEALYAALEARDFLEKFACPGWTRWLEWSPPVHGTDAEKFAAFQAASRAALDGPFDDWLRTSRLTLRDVLGVFSRAIGRAEFLARERR